MYSLLSSLMIFITIFSQEGKLTDTGILCVILIAFFIIAVILASSSAKHKKEITREEREELERLEREKIEASAKELAAKIDRYSEAREALVPVWGNPDKTIQVAEADINKEIRAYAKLKKVVIMGNIYDFSAVLNCHCTDNAVIEKGETIITSFGTTESNSGNILGRAIVGGMLAGGAGAVIGGTTAKKNTTTTSVINQGEEKTIHDYSIWISVKDIANPMIEIHIGSDEKLVNEIVALMKAIIAN